jgi:U3 small nucleolar RNA-associated protein 15
MVKVYDLNTFSVVHAFKYEDPVMSVAVSPDNTRLAVGMSSGMLSIRQRIIKMEDAAEEAKAGEALRSGSYRFFLRGASTKAAVDDVTGRKAKGAKLQAYDKKLKKFKYGEALNEALKTEDPVVIVSVMDELAKRDGLAIALRGRDEATLEPIIVFILRNITNPRYSDMLISVTNTVCDLYAPVLGQSAVIDDLFMRLQAKLKEESGVEKELLKLMGCLDCVMSASALHAGGKGGGSEPAAPVSVGSKRKR